MNALTSAYEWVLSAGLRASLVVFVVLAARWLLQKRLPSGWRYALWLPVLAALLVPALPILPEPLAGWLSPSESRGAESAIAQPPVPELSDPVLVVSSTARPGTAAAPRSAQTAAGVTPDGRAYVVSGWFVGALAVVILVHASFVLMLRRIQRTALPVDADVLARVGELSHDIGLRRAPRVWRSPAVSSPAVCGFWRPILLLNERFPKDLSGDEAGMVLRHELTHIRRGDLQLNALLCVLLALHWFNPLLWLAFFRVRDDREAACDEQVLLGALAPHRATYGHALLKLETASATSGLRLGFVGILQRGGTLRTRIQSIVSPPRIHPLMKTTIALSIITVTLLGIAKAAEEGGETSVSSKEFKEHYARVGMPETLRSTRYLGQRNGKALIRIHSMNPFTRSWSQRTIWVELDELEPSFRDEVVKAAENLPVEGIAFFEEKYQTKFTGVEPRQQEDAPDLFYAAIADQLGIGEIATEAAAARFGWRKGDGWVTSTQVKRLRGRWEVSVTRMSPADVRHAHTTLVCLDDEKKASFPATRSEKAAKGTGQAASTAVAEEDVAFFERTYQTKITGVKPIEEYDDPDTFYSTIAKQLGIPKLAVEAAAAESGWKEDDGKLTSAKVGRVPGQWQVMIARIATSPETKKPDPATLELKMVFIDDDKNVTFPEMEDRPRTEGVEREGADGISPQSLLAAVETARKHLANYLGGKPQNLADTYAERITLLPGHPLLDPKAGLAGPKGILGATTVERGALVKKLYALLGGRALLTEEQLEEYFKRAKTEILGVTSGGFVADPPKPIHTPDGKLHFAIEKGDVLLKIGDPARYFTFLQLRKIDGTWRVVAESKP